MWMTPLDWLMMWTRSWSIDPSIIGVLHKQENTTIKQVDDILNKESWLLWISQKSNDMREIIKWINQWDQNCQLALDMYINRIVKYIWWYVALMWWVDTIVFTAGILENKPIIRQKIPNRLDFMGIEVDNTNNQIIWKDIKISTKSSKINVIVIPTNEEYMIAKYSYKLINK
jgi:acetate kinase